MARQRQHSLTAFDLACRWLARVPHSRVEVDRYLRRLGFSDRAVATALARLDELHFIDDREFARSRAQALAARGYGDAWIAAALERHGIEGEAAALALAAIAPEPERARRVAGTTVRGGRMRSWNLLLRRGFSEASAEAVLGSPDADQGEPGWG